MSDILTLKLDHNWRNLSSVTLASTNICAIEGPSKFPTCNGRVKGPYVLDVDRNLRRRGNMYIFINCHKNTG